MLIRPSTTFAHPILSPHTDDYGDRNFDISLQIEEAPDAGEVTLTGQYFLDDPEVAELIQNETAVLGIVVECLGTYFQSFIPLTSDTFTLDFKNGQLRGRVAIQAVIAAASDDAVLHSDFITPDYPAHTKRLESGDVIAASGIHSFEAGLDKLLPMESIFRLVASDNVDGGLFQVGLDSETIEIEVNRDLYDVIYGIRGTSMRDILLPSLFLPVVMSAIDAMRTTGYEDRRWHSVIEARCNNEGIMLDATTDLALAAQRLLDGPLSLLRTMFDEGDK